MFGKQKREREEIGTYLASMKAIADLPYSDRSCRFVYLDGLMRGARCGMAEAVHSDVHHPYFGPEAFLIKTCDRGHRYPVMVAQPDTRCQFCTLGSGRVHVAQAPDAQSSVRPSTRSSSTSVEAQVMNAVSGFDAESLFAASMNLPTQGFADKLIGPALGVVLTGIARPWGPESVDALLTPALAGYAIGRIVLGTHDRVIRHGFSEPDIADQGKRLGTFVTQVRPNEDLIARHDVIAQVLLMFGSLVAEEPIFAGLERKRAVEVGFEAARAGFIVAMGEVELFPESGGSIELASSPAESSDRSPAEIDRYLESLVSDAEAEFEADARKRVATANASGGDALVALARTVLREPRFLPVGYVPSPDIVIDLLVTRSVYKLAQEFSDEPELGTAFGMRAVERFVEDEEKIASEIEAITGKRPEPWQTWEDVESFLNKSATWGGLQDPGEPGSVPVEEGHDRADSQSDTQPPELLLLPGYASDDEWRAAYARLSGWHSSGVASRTAALSPGPYEWHWMEVLAEGGTAIRGQGLAGSEGEGRRSVLDCIVQLAVRKADALQRADSGLTGGHRVYGLDNLGSAPPYDSAVEMSLTGARVGVSVTADGTVAVLTRFFWREDAEAFVAAMFAIEGNEEALREIAANWWMQEAAHRALAAYKRPFRYHNDVDRLPEAPSPEFGTPVDQHKRCNLCGADLPRSHWDAHLRSVHNT